MAKVKVLGRAVEITSKYNFSTLVEIEKYAPNALKLYDEDGESVTYRVMTTTSGLGTIDKNGTKFAKPVKGTEATVTLTVGDEVKDVKEYITENLGGALMRLNKLERTLEKVIVEMEKDKKAVLDTIEFVDEISEEIPTSNGGIN